MIKSLNALTNAIKLGFAPVFFVFLIAIASLSNYHKIIEIFWLSSSLKFFIFISIAILGLLLIVTKQLNIKSIGSVDITVITFLVYTSGNAIIKSLPNLPSEDIYISISLLLYYILLRFRNIYQMRIGCKLILFGLVALSMIQALLGIFQRFSVVEPYSISFKAAGTFINPGIYGCFLVLGLLIVISQLFRDSNNSTKKMIYCIISLLIFLALIYSGSRTSWLAFLGGFSIIGFLKINISGDLKKYKRIATIFIALSLVIGIYFIIHINTLSIDGRLLIWKISAPMAFVNPLTGLGYGSFFIQYGNFQAEYFLSAKAPETEVQLVSMNYYLFNEYYKIIIEDGIIGFVLFVLILVCIIRFLNQKLLQRNGQKDFMLLTSLPVGVALLIFGFFSYPSQDISINMILLSIIAMIGYEQVNFRRSWSVNICIKKNATYLISCICMAIIVTSSIKIWAIMKWKLAQENIFVQEGSSLHIYADIMPILANNGAFLYNYGSELDDIGMYKEANKVLKSASVYGNSVDLYLKLAENTMKLGDVGASEQYYLIATHMNPKLFMPLNALLDFYLKSGQKIKAKTLATELCKKKIKINSPKVFEVKHRACQYIQQYEVL